MTSATDGREGYKGEGDRQRRGKGGRIQSVASGERRGEAGLLGLLLPRGGGGGRGGIGYWVFPPFSAVTERAWYPAVHPFPFSTASMSQVLSDHHTLLCLLAPSDNCPGPPTPIIPSS